MLLGQVRALPPWADKGSCVGDSRTTNRQWQVPMGPVLYARRWAVVGEGEGMP